MVEEIGAPGRNHWYVIRAPNPFYMVVIMHCGYDLASIPAYGLVIQ
jgi:hypothetical protein